MNNKILEKELVAEIKRQLVPYKHDENHGHYSIVEFSRGMKVALRIAGYIVTNEHWKMINSEVYCVCRKCMNMPNAQNLNEKS